MGIVLGIGIFTISFFAMVAILSGGIWENTKWLATNMWYACLLFLCLHIYIGDAFWDAYLLSKNCNGQVVAVMGVRQCVPLH